MRCLDQGAGAGAFLESEFFDAFIGDHGDDHLAAGQFDDQFAIDRPLVL